MDAPDIRPMIDDLAANVDDLEKVLSSLLAAPTSTTAAKLPLLDRSKLYVLTTYAIESILFACLRLNGIDAKSHPVFAELGRTRQYFEKIKAVETGPQARKLVVDKAAAGRFIKHGLADNKNPKDQQIASQLGGTKPSHIRFDPLSDATGEQSHVHTTTMSQRNDINNAGTFGKKRKHKVKNESRGEPTARFEKQSQQASILSEQSRMNSSVSLPAKGGDSSRDTRGKPRKKKSKKKS